MARILSFLSLILAIILSPTSSIKLPIYGVWKGSPVRFFAPRGYSKQAVVSALLTIQDGNEYYISPTPTPLPSRNIFVNLEMKAPDLDDIRIVYWIDRNFTAPLVTDSFLLANLSPGFHEIPAAIESPHHVPALDMISDGFIAMNQGKFAVYEEPESAEDVVEVLHSFFDPAVEALADVWVWGERGSKNGLHVVKVRMNQGYFGTLAKYNGRDQDGGIIVKYHDHWEALFMAFPQQASVTNEAGEPNGPLLGIVAGNRN
ncbi:uncharacterized protein CTRU02_207933 [Colletotrichum truncatum]|uniref:Uncharacterized protein n=1 Tax=Colletotrichum truncatum TaxID=5467 RepID=A0ACC3Z271_COLTU|nr:uncharacterized protein CTRU02_11044 [Colletotrichum truncatum]KAF6786546.1 hypothetical protein CTRU02_11044 [Colletotrichum truncatum]